MFRLRKLTYVAVLVCVLLLNINVLATQQRDEAVNEAAELNDQAVRVREGSPVSTSRGLAEENDRAST